MAPRRSERRPMSSQTKRTMLLFHSAKIIKPAIKKLKVPMDTLKPARPTRFQGFKPRTPQVVATSSPSRAKGDKDSGEQYDGPSSEVTTEHVRVLGKIGWERTSDQDQAEVEAKDGTDEGAIVSELQGQADSKFQLAHINASLETPATEATQKQQITSRAEYPKVSTFPLRTYTGSRFISALRTTTTKFDEDNGESNSHDQDFIAEAFNDEGLDDLDRELLGELEFSQASPRTLASEQPTGVRIKITSKKPNISSKLPRLKRQQDEGHGEDMKYNNFESRQKRHQSNQEIPSVIKRQTAPRKLKAERQPNGNTNLPSRPYASNSRNKRSNTKKRKRPREVPEEGLVIVAEARDDVGFGNGEDDIPEVIEDPSSPIQPNSSLPRRRKRVGIVTYTIKPKKGWVIDPAQFRVPKLQDFSSRSQGRNQHTSSYCDGFEGKEAQPIGRPMIIRQPTGNRWQTPETFAFDMPELTLVREKHQEPGEKPLKKKYQKSKKISLNMSNTSKTLPALIENLMPFDGHEAEQLPNDHEVKNFLIEDNTPPAIDLVQVHIQLPIGSICPNKKPPQVLPYIADQQSFKSTIGTAPTEGLTRTTLHKCTIQRRSETYKGLREPHAPPNYTSVSISSQDQTSSNIFSQTHIASTIPNQMQVIKQQRQTARQRDVEALQQLSMVFISRPIYSDSSDGSRDMDEEDENEDEENAKKYNENVEVNEDYEKGPNHHDNNETKATYFRRATGYSQTEDDRANDEEFSVNLGTSESEKNQHSDSEEERAFHISTEGSFISEIIDLDPQHSEEKALLGEDVDGELAGNETLANRELGNRMPTSWPMINSSISSRDQTLQQEEPLFEKVLQSTGHHKGNIEFSKVQSSVDAIARGDGLGTQYQRPPEWHGSSDLGAPGENAVDSIQDIPDALHSDEFWRLKAPLSSSVLMEVENNDIVNSLSLVPTLAEILGRRHLSHSRKVGRPASMLTFVHSHQSPDLDATPFSIQPTQSPLPSKTSQSQKPNFEPEVLETQFMRPKDRESQQLYIPTHSYFDQTSQDLTKYNHTTPSLEKPVPYIFGDPVPVTSMEPASPALKRNSTPMQYQDKLGTLYRRPSTRQPSLRALTRKASLSLGTIPTRPSGQRRSMTITNPRLVPPIYKQATIPWAGILT
ncbi:hypothetical protein BGZ60DRAFT_555609 [Tricladium varicosporioides]|nr:hypothetical protein BGZ60DRAFT_555609 [Hymenoscyphus varicosporioides]